MTEETANTPTAGAKKPKVLTDILTGEGTNLVYVSGKLNGIQIDCDGPFEWTRKFTKPTWPFIPAFPEYIPKGLKSPVFDYGLGKWVEQDEDSQGKQIADLKTQFAKIQEENKTLKEQNSTLVQNIQNIQKGQTQTTSLLGELLPAVQQLSAFAANLQKQEASKEEGDK